MIDRDVWFTIIDALRIRRKYYEEKQRSYELLKDRVTPDRISPNERRAEAELIVIEKARLWVDSFRIDYEGKV